MSLICPQTGISGSECKKCILIKREVNGVKLIPYWEYYEHDGEKHEHINKGCRATRNPDIRIGETWWDVPHECVEERTDPFYKCSICGVEGMYYM